MSTILSRAAMRVLFAHARAVPLVPAPGVSVRATRAVLLALVVFCDRESWAGAWPAVPTLAERAEVSIRTARRALRVLEAAGIIVTEVGGGRRSSRYRITRPDPDVTSSTVVAPSVAGLPGQDDRRSPVSTSLPPFGRKRRTPPAASKSKRSTTIPDDIRPLADALAGRGLRASFSLTSDQVAEVRAAVARHGVVPLVRAAYAAHRATNPARWWSAWLGIWGGLTSTPAPAPPVTSADAPPARDPDRTVRGASAARASLAAYGVHPKAVVR